MKGSEKVVKLSRRQEARITTRGDDMVQWILIPKAARGRKDVGAIWLVRERISMVGGCVGLFLGFPLTLGFLLLVDLDPESGISDFVTVVIWIGSAIGIYNWIKPAMEKRALRALGVDSLWLSENEEEQYRERRRDNTRWGIAFVIWGFGCFIFLLLWDLQKSIPSPMGDIIAFIIYVAAFFYFLALWPIRRWVNRMLGDEKRLTKR